MRHATAPLKTLLARGLLALALLFAQQTAALHWLSHAIEATRAKASQSAPSEHCDECVALAGLGAAATPSSAALPSDSAQHVLIALPDAEARAPPLRLGFRSRAPPTLS